MSDPNKTKFHLVHLDFVAAMANTMEAGLKDGREVDGWLTKGSGEDYYNALLRHLSEYPVKGVSIDHAMASLSAVACNAYIMWSRLKRIMDKV